MTENNILVLKDFKIQGENSALEYLCFQSRRTQYSFGRFMLLNPSIWEDKQTERINYQLLLERIRLKHILDFEVYLLKKKIDEETIEQVIDEVDSTTDRVKLLELEEKLNELNK